MKKVLSVLTLILCLSFIVFVYWRYYFVLAEGTQAGVLNTFQKKGILFKTYEGKIIQSGFKANVQSNEFSFSVENPALAEALLKLSGKELNVHYKKYFGALPWRGMQQNIVDSIYEVREVNGQFQINAK